MRQFEGAFRQVVRATVERYCGCRPQSLPLAVPVRYYVFMNEPEGFAGEYLGADLYAYWLRVFYEQVKAVDPQAKIVAPALAVPGTWNKDRLRGEFLDHLLRSRELQDPSYPYIDKHRHCGLSSLSDRARQRRIFTA